MTVATQHRCLNAVSSQCTRGNGKPKRKRCGYCGSSFLVLSGVWGVFTWSPENRYPLSGARSVHSSESAARRAAERDDSLVWRFIVQ